MLTKLALRSFNHENNFPISGSILFFFFALTTAMYGFHFEGNCGTTDVKMFLNITQVLTAARFI